MTDGTVQHVDPALAKQQLDALDAANRQAREARKGREERRDDGGAAMTTNASTKAGIVYLRKAYPYLPLIEIARRMGVARGTVRKILLAAGLAPWRIVHRMATCAICGVQFQPLHGFTPHRPGGAAWYCPAHKWGRTVQPATRETP